MDPENLPGAESDHAFSLMDEMPEVSEHAIAAAAIDIPESPAAENVELDSAGVAFNPDIHTGTKTKKGEWRKKRGGPASSVVNPRQRAPEPAPDPEAATRAENEAKARAAGVMCAHTMVMMCSALGGDEWKPRTDPIDEMPMLEQAYGDYFVATGKTDFPPGLALMMACGTYALPRFTMPKTRSRIQRAKEWAAQKYATWKMRRRGHRVSASDATERALS